MRIYYVTVNTADEARQISRALLEQQLAVCTNWFPITCAYRWEERIVEEAETVLIVKTQADYREAIEEVIRQHISYTNFIGEIAPESVNESFLKWLNTEVRLKEKKEKRFNHRFHRLHRLGIGFGVWAGDTMGERETRLVPALRRESARWDAETDANGSTPVAATRTTLPAPISVPKPNS